MFDSLKRLFKGGNKEEPPQQKMALINEEIDEFEKEIQEYISYTEERKAQDSLSPVEQPQVLAQGGGMTSASSLLTPEEEKRVLGKKEPAPTEN